MQGSNLTQYLQKKVSEYKTLFGFDMNFKKHKIKITIACALIASFIFFANVIVSSFSCSREQEFQFIQIQQAQQDELIEQTGKAKIALLFTGSTRGNFEPCGCGGVYQGGLSRRATIIDKIRVLNRNTILLDTGDISVGGSRVQFEFLAQAYQRLKYDAIALGEGDIRLGIEDFVQLAQKYNLPFISSNLQIQANNKAEQLAINNVLPKFRIIKRAGRKIAIISVLAQRWLAILPMTIRKRIEYKKPAIAIKQITTVLKRQCDFIILLSHLGPGDREILKYQLDGIDLWIDNGGHQWTRKSVQSSEITKNIFLDSNPPLLISWKNDRRIGIAAIDLNKYLHVKQAGLVPIEKNILRESAFLEIYDAYKYAARQEMLSRIYSQYEQASTTQPVKFKYVSSETCAKCHKSIFDFWKRTAHAHAFATLVKEHRDDDPNCWACHTTGFRSPNGFSDPKITPELKNVGCQSCHKIDIRTHLKNAEKMSKRQKKISLITRSWHCRRCHVPHRSPNYDYKSYLKAISCKKAKTHK